MNFRREDTLEDYEIKLAMERAVRSEQRLQLDLKFEPEKKQPRSVIGRRIERAKAMDAAR
jgi:hypothetical protein